jgi:biopolymer transport protein ExbD
MPLKTSHDEMPSINLTPMLDIVFNLIIFFMVGSRFTDMESNIDLKVPEVASTAPLSEAPQKRVINVFRDGRIVLDRQDVSLTELVDQLSSAHSQYAELGVIVRGDADGAFQNVASVLTACRQAGVQDMGISVRLAQKER